MKVEGFASQTGFTADASYHRLCQCISRLPGVAFTKRPRFFLGAEDVHAEFTFKGCTFKIEPDPFERVFSVQLTEGDSCPEVQEIRDHVAQY